MQAASPSPQSSRPQLRWLRPVLYTLGGIFLVLLLLVILVPILFKDQITAKVRTAINENVNARVNFSDVDLSLLRRFPSATISIKDLEVVGMGDFAADTLIRTNSLDVSVDLWSVITGKQMQVKYIGLQQPRIRAIVLRDGRANWDIAKPDTAKPAQDSTPSEPFGLALQRYQVENGVVVYDDRSMPFYLELKGLDHSGSGDFTQDVLTLNTETNLKKLTVVYDSATYASNMRVVGDAGIRLDLVNSKYEFLDNRLTVNELPVEFSGWLALPDTQRITMDLKFGAPEASFKQLLSVVPGMYNQHFEKLTAQGTVAFGGTVQGTYHTDSMPRFDVSMSVKDGQFQYEGLPEPVNGVQVAARVFNTFHKLDSVQLDLSTFQLRFGNQPFAAMLKTKGIGPIQLDAMAKGAVDLASVTRIYPLPGYVLRGKLAVDAKAKGTYGPKQMPSLAAMLNLTDGYVKSDSLPAPLQDLRISLTANSDGSLPGTSINIPAFHGVLGGQTVDGRLAVADLDDPRYDFAAKGQLDLGQLMKLFPIEGTQLTGRIAADVAAKGRVSDIKKEQYAKVQASGTADVTDLRYRSNAFPAGLYLKSSRVEVSPQALSLSNTSGTVGKSDFAVTGNLRNYLPFFLQKNEVLEGAMSLSSRKLDLNEFLAEDPNAKPKSDTASVPMEVVQVPGNIRFTFNSSVDEVLYDKLTLSQLRGTIQVADKTIRLVDCRFNTLGGSFVANGAYRTTNPESPHVDFALNLSNIQIPQAYQAFTPIQALAPVAQYATGSMNSTITVSMDLLRNMMPKLQTLTADGVAQLLNTTVKGVPLLQTLSNTAKLPAIGTSLADGISIKDTKLKLRVSDGRLFVQPFDVNLGGYKMTVDGSNGLDKSLAYNLAVNVPAAQVQQVAGSLAGKIPGLSKLASQDVQVLFGVGGTFTKPTVLPKGIRTGSGNASTGESTVAGGVKQAVADTVDKVKARLQAEAEAKAQQEAGRIKAEADKARAEAEQRAKQEAAKLQQQAKDKLKKGLGGFFKKDS